MSESTIVLSERAQSIVKADVSAFKRDGKRYGDYVTEMKVTAETVADHVAEFRNAFRVTNPKADGAMVKAYATKVRNGLNYHVKGAQTKQSEPGVIRVSLSGDGGGTVTLREGDHGYNFALTLFGPDAVEADAA